MHLKFYCSNNLWLGEPKKTLNIEFKLFDHCFCFLLFLCSDRFLRKFFFKFSLPYKGPLLLPWPPPPPTVPPLQGEDELTRKGPFFELENIKVFVFLLRIFVLRLGRKFFLCLSMVLSGGSAFLIYLGNLLSLSIYSGKYWVLPPTCSNCILHL